MKIKQVLTFLIISFFIACSSSDDNVIVKKYLGFEPVKLKNNNALFLPFVLKEKKFRNKYYKAFSLVYEKILQEWKIVLPYQAEARIDTENLKKKFNKIKNSDPLTNLSKWKEIGEKLNVRYLILIKFLKPQHTVFKGKHKEITYTSDRNTGAEIPRSSFVYVNINMWYQKGDIHIIDVKKGRLVYYLKKETKAGYNRRSSRGYGPSNLREALSSTMKKEIPTLLNVITIFLKNIFEDWK